MDKKFQQQYFAKLMKPGRHSRRAKRYMVNIELQQVNGQPAEDSELLDLSANGARVELPQALPLNSSLELTVMLTGAAKPTSLLGRVLWVKPVLNDLGRYQVGLQFLHHYWEIDHWLRQVQGEGGAPGGG